MMNKYNDLEKTNQKKAPYIMLGKSCYAISGAIAGFPIGGILGSGVGVLLGVFLGKLVEKSTRCLSIR